MVVGGGRGGGGAAPLVCAASQQQPPQQQPPQQPPPVPGSPRSRSGQGWVMACVKVCVKEASHKRARWGMPRALREWAAIELDQVERVVAQGRRTDVSKANKPPLASATAGRPKGRPVNCMDRDACIPSHPALASGPLPKSAFVPCPNGPFQSCPSSPDRQNVTNAPHFYSLAFPHQPQDTQSRAERLWHGCDQAAGASYVPG